MSPPPLATLDSDLLGEEVPQRYRVLDSICADSKRAEDDDMLLLAAGEEPTSFADAEPHENWRKAMLEELTSISENNTWTLTNLPAGK